jgi:hypothetical protein
MFGGVLMTKIIEGRVSAVYPNNNTVKVKRDDNETVTRELIVLQRGDNWLPNEGDYVLCLLGKGNGYVLGAI